MPNGSAISTTEGINPLFLLLNDGLLRLPIEDLAAVVSESFRDRAILAANHDLSPDQIEYLRLLVLVHRKIFTEFSYGPAEELHALAKRLSAQWRTPCAHTE